MNDSLPTGRPYELPPGHPLQTEWAAYCRELPRLLAEGNEGRFALVQGENIVSLWDSRCDAVRAGYQRFGLTKFLVHQIQRIERPIRIRGMS